MELVYFGDRAPVGYTHLYGLPISSVCKYAMVLCLDI